MCFPPVGAGGCSGKGSSKPEAVFPLGFTSRPGGDLTCISLCLRHTQGTREYVQSPLITERGGICFVMN